MNIDTNKLKTGVTAAVALVAVGFGAYWYSASVHKPPIVSVSQSGAGVPANTGFGIPLATLTEAAPGLGAVFGPLEGPADAATLRVAFDPSVDGRGREVTLHGDTLMLPVTFGRDGQIPQRITITYRDGDVASVRYQGKSAGGSTFSVVRPEPEELADATLDAMPDVLDEEEDATAIE
jgi:hypothetical protein